MLASRQCVLWLTVRRQQLRCVSSSSGETGKPAGRAPHAKFAYVKAILVNERDKIAAITAPSWISPPHEHVRGPGYYQ